MATDAVTNMLEMQTHLQMRLRVVAERIVEAARVAAAMHLMETRGSHPHADHADDEISAPPVHGRHSRFTGAD